MRVSGVLPFLLFLFFLQPFVSFPIFYIIEEHIAKTEKESLERFRNDSKIAVILVYDKLETADKQDNYQGSF